MVLESGTRFGSYEVLSLLGKGGMGEVYLAEDSRLKRQVALKILPPRFTREADRVLRFEREAIAASALNHPNIITIYEIAREGDAHYIATEFVDGETLQELIGRGLELRTVLDVGSQIARALGAAHANRIIHRDLKPDNVKVRPDGIVKVLDFGLAKLVEPLHGGGEEKTASLIPVATNPGTVMGTVSYMSPEQARGMEVDARSDIFTLGVLLYEMVAGRPPFQGETPSHVIVAILEKQPPSVSHISPGVPAAFERIIAKALAKDREERYQTAAEILNDLEGLETQLEFEAELSRSLPPPVGEGGAPLLQPPPPEAARGPRLRPAGRLPAWLGIHKVAAAAALLALILAGASAVFYHLAMSGRATMDSIAVLPLKNLSGDAEQDYFAEGLTEALITNLAKIQALRVISRTSVMRYLQTAKSSKEIARELNVDLILDGSVIQVGDRVRVTARLIKAEEDVHLWAENYDEDLRDILVLQGRVASTIAGEIHIQLTSQEKTRLATTQIVNPEVHRLYLKGRYFWNRRTPEDLRRSLEYFERAIAGDPGYALAHAGLADAYAILGSEGYDMVPPGEAMPKAKAAALQALALDQTLGEAHATLAFVKQRQWDWTGAEADFRRAIEYNPGHASAHQWYSSLLWVTGRPAEAAGQIRRAQELDPLSLIISTNIGVHAYFAGDYEAAIEELRKVIAMEPNFWIPYVWLGLSYAEADRYEEAKATAEKAVILTGRIKVALAVLGHVYGRAGEKARAQQLLEELEGRAAGEYVAPFLRAWIHAGTGNRDRAFAWLERAVRGNDAYLSWFFRNNPSLDSLRPDPRYDALLASLGLPK